MPGLAERDVEEFGGALTRIQQRVGDAFAPVQNGRFHPLATPMIDALAEFGAAGVGQSSWGPTVYGIVGWEAEGERIANAVATAHGDAVPPGSSSSLAACAVVEGLACACS